MRTGAARHAAIALLALVTAVTVLFTLTRPTPFSHPYFGPEDPLLAAVPIIGAVGVVLGAVWVWRISHDDSLDDAASWRYRDR